MSKAIIIYFGKMDKINYSDKPHYVATWYMRFISESDDVMENWRENEDIFSKMAGKLPVFTKTIYLF